MKHLRIQGVSTLGRYRLKLTLTDGSVIERDVERLLQGPIFDPIRRDPSVFASVRVEGGSIVWPNGADLCPDVLIWNGDPPEEAAPLFQVLDLPA